MDVSIPADSKFREIFESIHLSSKVLVYLLLSFVVLLIVLLLPAFQKCPLLILDLLSGTIHHSRQVLNKLFIITQIVLRYLQSLLVNLY